jgi:uncharacterized protein YbbK (DUF523 family)
VLSLAMAAQAVCVMEFVNMCPEVMAGLKVQREEWVAPRLLLVV